MSRDFVLFPCDISKIWTETCISMYINFIIEFKFSRQESREIEAVPVSSLSCTLAPTPSAWAPHLLIIPDEQHHRICFQTTKRRTCEETDMRFAVKTAPVWSSVLCFDAEGQTFLLALRAGPQLLDKLVLLQPVGCIFCRVDLRNERTCPRLDTPLLTPRYLANAVFAIELCPLSNPVLSPIRGSSATSSPHGQLWQPGWA